MKDELEREIIEAFFLSGRLETSASACLRCVPLTKKLLLVVLSDSLFCIVGKYFNA